MTDSKELISLHRYLKSLKRFSVREGERLIRAGRVSVNGVVVDQPQERVAAAIDLIALDGEPLVPEVPDRIVLLFNKPRGVVCSRSDEKGRETIFDMLPQDLGYLFSIGRLDLMSDGAILITNDGDLARRLSDPRFKVKKLYRVKLQGTITQAQLEPLERGVVLEGRKTRPCRIRVEGKTAQNTWTLWELKEGKNRQIRRMCEESGLFTMKIVRLGIGDLRLGKLPVGSYRQLTPEEIASLEGTAASSSRSR
jgi:23S rRNA pseudouridine2605 synthase